MQLNKKIIALGIVIVVLFPVLAYSYTSLNYTIINPKIISSGGTASSFNYSLNNVIIGKFLSGKVASANYTLDATTIDIMGIPNAPTFNPVITPTNISTQTVSGTKDADTSIYINGYEAVPLDSNTTWSYDVVLNEGNNYLVITARNTEGLESESVYITIILDTVSPLAPVLNPVITPTNTSIQIISGTKEADTSIWINAIERISINSSTLWSINVSLLEGNNTLNIIAKDAVLNESLVNQANILLDTSAPTIPEVIDDGIYTTDNSELHASWASSDPETGIVEYQYAIGTSAGGTDVINWTSSGLQIDITHTGLALIQGQIYYISVKAKNGVGDWSPVGVSDGIKMNQNMPQILAINPLDDSTGYTQDNINCSITAQDQDGDSLLYQFSVDGQVVQSWQSSTDFNWATSGVSPGVHIMTFEVNDNNGGIVSQDVDMCLFRKPPAQPIP